MLHVRVCTIERKTADEVFGFDLWRSRRRSSQNHNTAESADGSDLLIVKAVTSGGPAAGGNLREGDKIIAVNGVNVRTANEVRQLLDNKLEARVMVERWEGPKVDTSFERKASDPTAPHKRDQRAQTSRRRSNTLRSMPIDPVQVQRWPRNYGLAQNYPATGNGAGEPSGLQVGHSGRF